MSIKKLTLVVLGFCLLQTVTAKNDHDAVTIAVDPDAASTVATTGTDSRMAAIRQTADKKAQAQAAQAGKSYVGVAPDPNDPSYWKTKNTGTMRVAPDSGDNQTPENTERHMQRKEAALEKILSTLNTSTNTSFHSVSFKVTPRASAATTTQKGGTVKTALALPGTLWYATMATGADSYVPGPVMATVQQGPFSGANAIGKFQVAPDGEHLILLFSQMAFHGRTYRVSAVAMDPDTRISGITGSIDHHIWTRFILPGAATFLEKVTDALTSENQSTTLNNAGIVVSKPKLTDRQLALIGAGGATKAFADATRPQGVLRLPQVRIAANQGIGFLLLKPITE